MSNRSRVIHETHLIASSTNSSLQARFSSNRLARTDC